MASGTAIDGVPEDEWREVVLLAALPPNGQLLVTGGNTAWRKGSVLWAANYDPAADAWTRVATPRWAASTSPRS